MITSIVYERRPAGHIIRDIQVGFAHRRAAYTWGMQRCFDLHIPENVGTATTKGFDLEGFARRNGYTIDLKVRAAVNA